MTSVFRPAAALFLAATMVPSALTWAQLQQGSPDSQSATPPRQSAIVSIQVLGALDPALGSEIHRLSLSTFHRVPFVLDLFDAGPANGPIELDLVPFPVTGIHLQSAGTFRRFGDLFNVRVPSGRQYVLRFDEKRSGTSTRVIDVPDGSERVDVALDLAEELESLRQHATINIEAFAGKRRLDSPHEMEIRFQDPATGIPVQAWPVPGSPNQTESWCYRIPARPVRVIVRERLFTGCGSIRPVRKFARTTRELSLASGDHRDVRIDLERGGRLLVALTGEPSDDERRSSREDVSPFDTTGYQAGAGIAGRVMLVILDRNRGICEPLSRTVDTSDVEGVEASVSTWILGTTATADGVPTGTFELIGRLAGGREARTSVTVLEGEVTGVNLDFD